MPCSMNDAWWVAKMVQSTVLIAHNGAEFKICRQRGIYEKEFVNDEVPVLHHQMLVMVARILRFFLHSWVEKS